jgi:acyl-CoA thioester hydrolase
VDEAYELMGCGIAYLKETSYTFTAEAHFRYLRELHAGMQVRVTLQLIDFDAKRMHYFEQLCSRRGRLALGHVREHGAAHHKTAKKVVPFPDFISARLAKVKAAHAHLPVPEGAGRRIAMPGK